MATSQLKIFEQKIIKGIISLDRHVIKYVSKSRLDKNNLHVFWRTCMRANFNKFWCRFVQRRLFLINIFLGLLIVCIGDYKSKRYVAKTWDYTQIIGTFISSLTNNSVCVCAIFSLFSIYLLCVFILLCHKQIFRSRRHLVICGCDEAASK